MSRHTLKNVQAIPTCLSVSEFWNGLFITSLKCVDHIFLKSFIGFSTVATAAIRTFVQYRAFMKKAILKNLSKDAKKLRKQKL